MAEELKQRGSMRRPMVEGDTDHEGRPTNCPKARRNAAVQCRSSAEGLDGSTSTRTCTASVIVIVIGMLDRGAAIDRL
jgi:hypothetical protein